MHTNAFAMTMRVESFVNVYIWRSGSIVPLQPRYHDQEYQSPNELQAALWPPCSKTRVVLLEVHGCARSKRLSGPPKYPTLSQGSLQDVAEDFDEDGNAATDGYVFNAPSDMQGIRMQRQAIWGLLRNLGSHILREGVNLTKITLPIRVFEPRSFLQRLTDNWAYVHLLEQAADALEPAERMRYLVGLFTMQYTSGISHGGVVQSST